MCRKLYAIAALLTALASPSIAQDKSSYEGVPSVHYQGSKGASLYAGVSEYQGAKAILYTIGFEPHQSAGSTAGKTGIALASGGLVGAAVADKMGWIGPKKYFGKLYITADQVTFVPADEKHQKLSWSLKRSEVTISQANNGQKIEPASEGNKTVPSGLIHFQPIEDSTGKLEFKKPEEAPLLHKKHLDPPMEAFLADFQATLSSFDDTYGRLAKEAGAGQP
jgi:hypothetical protein